MSYVATGEGLFRSKGGSLSHKLGYEFAQIQSQTDTLNTNVTRSITRRWNLTPNMGTDTALATTGISLKTGATYYAKFFTDVAVTIVGMVTYQTEAYAKDTTDAKIELKTEASSPVTKVTYTFPAAGRAAKTVVNTTPTSATLAAGDALDIVITATGASGTGYCKIELLYTVN